MENVGERIKAEIKKTYGFRNYSDNPRSIGIIRRGTVPAVPPAMCALEGTLYSSPDMDNEMIAEKLDFFSAIFKALMSAFRKCHSLKENHLQPIRLFV